MMSKAKVIKVEDYGGGKEFMIWVSIDDEDNYAVRHRLIAEIVDRIDSDLQDDYMKLQSRYAELQGKYTAALEILDSEEGSERYYQNEYRPGQYYNPPDGSAFSNGGVARACEAEFERAAIVEWLRTADGIDDDLRYIAKFIERGDHLRGYDE